MTYETRTTKIAVGVKGDPIFSESITEVEIIDEVAGEFIEVRQEDGSQKLRFDKDEWPHIRSAVNKMFKLCRNYD